MLLYFFSYTGPHPLSLGEAYASYYDRVEAIYYNPASAAVAPRVMVSVYHSGYGYNGGGFVYPNRFLSFGLHVLVPQSYERISGQFVLARSFGTLNLGAGASLEYPLGDSGTTVEPSFYAGVSFSPLDYFLFGFSVFNIETPESLSSRIGMYVSSIPVPFFGRSLSLYTDMEVKFNSTAREVFRVGTEFRPIPSLFFRMGYEGGSGWKGGLGYLYVYNTTDIYFDLGADSLFSDNRIYNFGITVKFLGYDVWVESTPKVIELMPSSEYNVVKVCLRYNLPAEVDRWILKITNRWGKVYKVYYGDGSIPTECIYWQGTDEYGNYVGKGVYFYHFYVKTRDGRIFERRGALVNIKKGVGQ